MAAGLDANTGTGVAALSAIPGLNTLLLPALLSMAPGLISSLFGSQQKKLMKQIRKLSASQGGLAEKYYQQNLASPAYSQAQGTIAAGANATGSNIAQQLGASGIGTSGTGAILSSLVPSIVGQQQAGLRTSAFQGAQGQAQNEIQQQIQALLGSQGPSQTQQLFGAGINAFAPYLQNYLTSRYPTAFPRAAG